MTNLSSSRDLHVGVGQDELADGGVQHEAVDAVVDGNDPVHQDEKYFRAPQQHTITSLLNDIWHVIYRCAGITIDKLNRLIDGTYHQPSFDLLVLLVPDNNYVE